MSAQQIDREVQVNKLVDKIRTFESGATRSAEGGKPDYEGFLSPAVLEAFGVYMTQHRIQADGTLRDSDNWQKGIPQDQYLKSLLRHVIDLWSLHRGHWTQTVQWEYDLRSDHEARIALACAILFNVQGYLFEELKGEQQASDSGA